MVQFMVNKLFIRHFMQIIWNSSTRAEMLKFVDQQRASQGPDGSYDLSESQTFTYQALSKELHIGNVYLRVYNNQPDYEISEPEVFSAALLKYISDLVHRLIDLDVAAPNHNFSSSESSELQNGTLNIINDEDKVNEVPKVGERSEEDAEIMKNLQSGLTALQVHQVTC